MGDDEAGVSCPGVDAVPAIAPAGGHKGAITNYETEPEAAFHFFLPLPHDSRGARNHNPSHFLADQHFPQNQSRLDRFAQAYVVGNK